MSAEITVTGSIIKIMETESFGDNGFTKRLFVVKTDEKFPQELACELIKDKTTMVDGYAEGDNITVSVNLRGREYNGKWYTSLTAWKIARNGAATGAPAAESVEEDALPY